MVVQLTMRRAEDGGRRERFSAGYKTHWIVAGTSEHLGVCAQNASAVSPGDEAQVPFDLLYFPNVDYGLLRTGAIVSVVEGAKVVGEGIVTRGVDVNNS